MKKTVMAMLGVVALACMSPSVSEAGSMLPLMMEHQSTVNSVDLGNHTVVINGVTFHLAPDVVVHASIVNGKEQRTALKAGDAVGYQVDKNNTKLIRQITIMPHR